MPPFPKPDIAYTYDVAAEKRALRAHRKVRGIPAKTADAVLIATWNIANLGTQLRRDTDFALIAEMLSWFDIVAVQEVNDNFADLVYIVQLMGTKYRYVMSDAAGNNERMAFVYDSRKIKLAEEIGEVAFPPSQYQSVRVDGVTGAFAGFDRSPYLATFVADHFSLTLLNVHLYFGGEQQTHIHRRALETAAVARWSRIRAGSKYATTRDVLALGDFNMPRGEPGNLVYGAATQAGLKRPLHSSQVASAIASDNQYDQILYFPEQSEPKLKAMGVFDYDTAIFSSLWQGAAAQDRVKFSAYLRYYMSDHRPVWCQMSMREG